MAKSLKSRIASLLFAAVFAALCFVAPGCRGRVSPPEPTEEPRVTEAPPVSYEMTQYLRFWPEKSDSANCDYCCSVQLPEFSKSFTAGYAMNRAVDAYLEELASRIETKYLPGAIVESPLSQVSCEVKVSCGVTNVIFTEEHYYEAQPERAKRVLMLDERGNELTIRDLFCNYHADDLAAAAVFEKISGDPAYYPVEESRVLAAIDIKRGVIATEGGCIVCFDEGVLAPFEEGVIEFELAGESLTPDFVGEGKLVSFREYLDIVRFLGFVANASAVRGESISEGLLSEYAATGFMGRAVTELGVRPAAGRIPVPAERFEAMYRACFGNDFPGIDTEAHDIKLIDGVYSVSAAQKDYYYNVDLLSASEEGGALTLTGDVIFGKFGYSNTAFVCHVTVRLTKNPESPFGFTLGEYALSL
ncbi:MAG: hypothetical protein K6G56_01105 [Clostridiales bacterium]|nr:hypothetical protein [Clostridiales bacterium]